MNIQHLTHSSQPQAKQPMFQQKTTNKIHENQHTLTFPLDSWLNPGMFMDNSESYSESHLIIEWTEPLQILALCWILIRFIATIIRDSETIRLRILGHL